ncbi:MAG TPA: phosphohydrolase, partial [Anaeromyxobacter sp.]|nr:phosphohydrolase [Anaeromyxobacter sp.]
MFDRLTLDEDLIDCRGAVIGRRGLVISPEAIAEAARHASPLPRRRLAETPLAGDVDVALEDPSHAALFKRNGARPAVERALL